MGSVTFKDIRKSYGAVEVLHGIDFGIEDGEFCILVGASGCGKSTLLRMLAGLESVTSGEIMINDKVVNDVRPKQRDIAMVFQSYALYPHMTVAQNMGFSLRLAGVPKPEIAERVGKAAEIIGLTDFLDRQPKALSGGQRQRVAMGRAIVRDPQVFLFDEPLSNLDAKLRVQMRAEIRSLQQSLGTTTVYVTHDQVEAMTMADRIVILDAGVVQQQGAPLDLYDNPANRFVAGFIGSPSMNFFETEVVEGGLKLSTGYVIPNVGGGAARGKVIYGVRPEHVEIGEGGAEAAVDVVEPLGSETLVQVTLAGVKVTLLSRDRLNLKPREIVPLHLDNPTHHMFDPDTGLHL